MSDSDGRDDRDRHERETDEFGGPLFSERGDRGTSEQPLSFGSSDTGPLPHWTDPPTGEVPRLEPTGDAGDAGEGDDEVDVWSTFTSESPIWREDVSDQAENTGQIPQPDMSNEFGLRDPSGGVDRPRDPSGPVPRAEPSGERPVTEPDLPPPGAAPTPREPSRIQIGTDPSGLQRRQAPQQARRSRGGGTRRSGTGVSQRQQPASASRDMPMAVIAAVVIAGAFVAASVWRPVAVLAIVVVILAIASYEYFTKVTEKGYRPAVAAGVLACVAAPLAAYWLGDGTLPLVVAFAFMAGAAGFFGASSIESGPLPNMAVTTMGVVWIGVLGSYAALILTYSTSAGSPPFGTDTLVLVALGVAANDIGALFIGSSTGNTPLREWISPGKTLEGLIGGTVMTIVSLLVVGLANLSDTWNDTGEILLLAVVIAVMAPIGDLTESMFKRNLDVKDFGNVVPGHGGVLDRFDGFMFVLPAVYYLMVTLEPWTS